MNTASLTQSSIWGTSQVTRSDSDFESADAPSLTRFPRRGIIQGPYDTGMHEEGEPTRTEGAPWDTLFVLGTGMDEGDGPSVTRPPPSGIRGPFDTVVPFDNGMQKESRSRTSHIPFHDTYFVIGTYVPEEGEPSTTQSPPLGTAISSSSDGDKTRGPDYTVSDWFSDWLYSGKVSSTGSSLGNVTRHNTTRPSHLGTAIPLSNVTSTMAISTTTQSFNLTSVVPYSDANEVEASTITQAPETVTEDPLPMSTTVTKTIAGYRVLIIPYHEYMYDTSNDSETVVATTTIYSDPPTSMATGNATGATPKRVQDLAAIIIPPVAAGVVFGVAM